VYDDPWSKGLARRLLCQSFAMEVDGERGLANAYEQAVVVREAIDILRCDLARLHGAVVGAKACVRMSDLMSVLGKSPELSRECDLTRELHQVVSDGGDIADVRAALLELQIEADRRVSRCVSCAEACITRMLIEARVVYYMGSTSAELVGDGLATLTSIEEPCVGSSVKTHTAVRGIGDPWVGMMPYQVNCYDQCLCALYLLTGDQSFVSQVKGGEAALLLLCAAGTRVPHVKMRDEDAGLIAAIEAEL